MKSQSNRLLLVSASERRGELKDAMYESLNVPITIATTFAEALAAIAATPCKAVILDEGLADLDPAGAAQLLERCADELPIFVKLAISGTPRCLQQIQLAIRRFDREQQIALASAQDWVRSQLGDALTSILISCQLTLDMEGLPPAAQKHVSSILAAGEVLQERMSPTPE
jgi:hypothetical protein